jgi:hypothetical protein
MMPTRALWWAGALLLFAGAAQASAPGTDATGAGTSFEAPAFTTPAGAPSAAAPEAGLALASPWVGSEPPALAVAAKSAQGAAREPAVLGAGRAQILLRSLTVPGWGQYSTGHHTAAGIFALAETGIWVSFASFRIQEQMRREAYERTARLLAGIELRGRDEEFRRVVGAYISSDEYNQLVVFRDAANLHYDDPAAYRAYIAEHSLSGNNVWAWNSEESLLRYRAQRRSEDRASLRANTALALAVINRILSALHAARVSGDRVAEREVAPPPNWSLEVSPFDACGASAIRVGVRRRF